MSTTAGGTPSPPSPRRSHAARNIGVVLVVVLIVAASGLYLVLGGGAGMLGVGPAPHTVNIVNGVQTVNAGSYQSYQVTVPAGATKVSIQGTFTASGGPGNDVIVYVMNSTQYVNWQNGHQTASYYDSGRLTTMTFDATLPSGPGTYYLVYDNTFSLLAQKSVTTQVNLAYTA